MDLYYLPGSPPCRAVMLTGAVLGIDFNLIKINPKDGENKTPEYLQMNPQHTVPVLVDDGLTLIESKAIVQYLAEQYGADDTLYPKDPQARALVNQRMFFDVTLYSSMPRFYFPMFFQNKPENPMMRPTIDGHFKTLDKFLEEQDYAALGQLTIADLVLVTTVSCFELFGIEIENYPNVQRWYQNLMETMPGIETHLAGVEATKSLLLPQKSGEEEEEA